MVSFPQPIPLETRLVQRFEEERFPHRQGVQEQPRQHDGGRYRDDARHRHRRHRHRQVLGPRMHGGLQLGCPHHKPRHRAQRADDRGHAGAVRPELGQGQRHAGPQRLFGVHDRHARHIGGARGGRAAVHPGHYVVPRRARGVRKPSAAGWRLPGRPGVLVPGDHLAVRVQLAHAPRRRFDAGHRRGRDHDGAQHSGRPFERAGARRGNARHGPCDDVQLPCGARHNAAAFQEAQHHLQVLACGPEACGLEGHPGRGLPVCRGQRVHHGAQLHP